MKKFSTKEINFIINNYSLSSIKNIATALNRDYTVVKHKTHKLKLTSYTLGTNPNSRKKRKYNCNDNYFTNPTIENCYWAGFLAADGYINDYNKNFPNLGIMLSTKDKLHLQKFVDDINFEGPILEGISNNFPMCYAHITSKKIIDDLYKLFSITPRKSLTLAPPKITNETLKDAFIIGYIDGDGSISFKCKQLQILGTLKLLEWIKSRFDDLFGTNSCRIYKRKNQYNLVLYRVKIFKNMIEYYNNYCVPKLNRKWKPI